MSKPQIDLEPVAARPAAFALRELAALLLVAITMRASQNPAVAVTGIIGAVLLLAPFWRWNLKPICPRWLRTVLLVIGTAVGISALYLAATTGSLAQQRLQAERAAHQSLRSVLPESLGYPAPEVGFDYLTDAAVRFSADADGMVRPDHINDSNVSGIGADWSAGLSKESVALVAAQDELYLQRLYVARAYGDDQQALMLCDAILERNPHDPHALYEKGVISLRLNPTPESLREAIRWFETVFESDDYLVKYSARYRQAVAIVSLMREAADEDDQEAYAAEASQIFGEVVAAADAYSLPEHLRFLSLVGEAEILKIRRQDEAALKKYDEAIGSASADLHRTYRAIAEGGRARVLFALGKVPEATVSLDYISEALVNVPRQYSAKLGTDLVRIQLQYAQGRYAEGARNQLGIASVAESRGQTETARNALLEASGGFLYAAERAGTEEIRTAMLASAGDAIVALDNLRPAIEAGTEWECWRLMRVGRIQLLQGSIDDAESTWSQAAKIVESLNRGYDLGRELMQWRSMTPLPSVRIDNGQRGAGP